MATMEAEYDLIYHFLCHREYPSGYTKNQKRSLRRKVDTCYKMDNGVMMFFHTTTGLWKQVPRSEKDKERILGACHSLPEGNLSVTIMHAILYDIIKASLEIFVILS